jgi:hypothetical protein
MVTSATPQMAGRSGNRSLGHSKALWHLILVEIMAIWEVDNNTGLQHHIAASDLCMWIPTMLDSYGKFIS